MKTKEIKNKYKLVSGETTVIESPSIPKICSHLGIRISWVYKHKPKDSLQPWIFNYKGFEYQLITLA